MEVDLLLGYDLVGGAGGRLRDNLIPNEQSREVPDDGAETAPVTRRQQPRSYVA
jgi:hypothetical protein